MKTQACDAKLLAKQIGGRVIMGVSGGRVYPIISGKEVHGLWLPVAKGYRVFVYYQANDTYKVQRVLVRAAKVTVKQEWTDVYAENIGEVVIAAADFYN